MHTVAGGRPGQRGPPPLLCGGQRGPPGLPPLGLHAVAGQGALYRLCTGGGGETNGGWHSHHCHTTGLWNNVFLVSNVCLLLLLPFGHFFMEAEGFTWSRKVSTAAAAHASCPAHPVCPAPAPGPVVQGVRVLSGGGTDGGVAGAGGLGGLLPLAARQHPK